MPHHNFEKREWWHRTVAFILASPKLFNKSGKLSGHYMEMFGLSGYEVYILLKLYLENPKYFWAIEIDPIISYLARVELLQRPESDRFQCIYGNFFALAVRAASDGLGLIYNVDTTQQIHDKIWFNHGKDLLEIVLRTLEHYPQMVLLLNGSLDRSPERASYRLAQYTKELCELFAPWRAKVDRFLGPGSRLATLADDTSYLGQIGAYHVNRSINRDTGRHRNIRMASLRLRFNSNRTMDIENEARS